MPRLWPCCAAPVRSPNGSKSFGASLNRRKSGANIKSIWKKEWPLYESRNLTHTARSSFNDLDSLIWAKGDFSPEVERYSLQEKIRPTGIIRQAKGKTPKRDYISFKRTLHRLRNWAIRDLSFRIFAVGNLNSMHCVSITMPKNSNQVVGNKVFFFRCRHSKSAWDAMKSLQELATSICNRGTDAPYPRI